MTRFILALVLLATVLASEGRHYHGLEARSFCSPLYDPTCLPRPHRPRPVLCSPLIDPLCLPRPHRPKPVRCSPALDPTCLPRPSLRGRSLLDDMFEPRMSGRSVIIPCWRPEFKTSSYCGYVPPPSAHPYDFSKGWIYT